MRKLLLALALVCTAAHADRYWIDAGGAKLTLHDKPCSHEGLAYRLKGNAAQFKRATAVVGFAVIEGCWSEKDGHVYVIYTDGDSVSIPVQRFKGSDA